MEPGWTGQGRPYAFSFSCWPATMAPTGVASDPVCDLLAQQAARRSRQVPVLSVLAGPPLAGLRCWRSWLATSQRSSVVTSLTEPGEVARLLITALAQRHNLADNALGAIAEWWGRPVDELRARLTGQTEAD